MIKFTSYSLSDFILFSETTYYRQFELYNNAIWPLHIIAIAFSIMILYAFWKKPIWGGRFIAMLLIFSWGWVAWAFLYERFYSIHVVANWYAWGFVIQAGLLWWYGIVKNHLIICEQNHLRTYIGRGLLCSALILYPFIILFSGRSWMQFEMFALTPDPTVLATLAILLLCKVPLVLYIIPIVWGIISCMTLLVM